MIYHKNDPASIQNMFNSIARRYDTANAVLSFQMHKYWNRKLISLLLNPPSSSPLSFLDLCCGTGDIAIEFLKKSPIPCQAHLIDFCSNMLDCAKIKMSHSQFKKHQIQYLEADAHAIPLPNESIHFTTLAYGIRNVKTPLTCIQEIYRILKPGGRLGILELTQPQNKLWSLAHRFYLKSILPITGKWLTHNHEAYQYLHNSIQNFIAPSELEKMMNQCHFTQTFRYSLAGGIATILIGTKHAL